MQKLRRKWLSATLVALTVTAVAVMWWPGTRGWSQSPRRSALHSLRIAWPADGESAVVVVGRGHRVSRPSLPPVPIASVAKVMTAYVVLGHYPLASGAPGFTLTLTDADAQLSQRDAADGQSYVPVVAGEELSEREALEALLLPSANNIAMALADHVAGSPSAFVADMNSVATSLGMHHTTYTDPSGLDVTTISTAADQLKLARAAMRLPALADIMGLPQAMIPVVGSVANTDTLLGRDGFVAGKTGSDTAAGGCFMFESLRTVRGRQVTVIGVVLGQRGGSLIQAALAAADDLVDSVVDRLAMRRRR